MLKALQLHGFKSFADKTRFEFPAGITVVVGPNGSGKSNVVDAIKWVLGEQSAKSLRGKDMADVIFKGSGTAGRKPLNTAEATIEFDNSERRLPIDAPEVHVTRRVYRSGEGEYLINGQPCRLKDVRDLFRGTGVGTDAYSLIEQGKVDRLLQASPKDRRAIFEEAAGISRFKAKKLEAQRRLERVEQNLLRLSDIVEEVDNRLRNVRSQAAKARRYREYTERLQQLRTQVGLTDWRQLSEKLGELRTQLAAVRDELAQRAARSEAAEARQLELETDLVEVAETIRGGEHRLARNREQIAALEAAQQHERTRVDELRQLAARHRTQLAAMNSRAGNLQQQLADTTSELESAEAERRRVAELVSGDERALEALSQDLAAHRRDSQQRRGEYIDGLKNSAALASQVDHLQQQAAAATGAAEQARQRLAELDAELQRQVAQLHELRETEQALVAQMEENAEQLRMAEEILDDNRRLVERRKEELSLLHGRLTGVQERASLLDEWQRNREGLTAGVRQLLAQAAEAEHGPLTEIRGVVADLVNVDVELAPQIDAALGEISQHLVLQGELLWDQVRRGELAVAGRVGFVRADLEWSAPPGDPSAPIPDLTGRPGVAGRADRLVQCRPEFQPLVRRLLGETWLVDSLETACQLQRVAPRLRFVTAAGEVLDQDGRLLVGPRGRGEALVSRRSELRLLRQQLAVLQLQMDEGQREVLRLQENDDRHALAIRQLSDLRQHLAMEVAELRAGLRSAQQQCEHLQRRREVTAVELAAAEGSGLEFQQQREARQGELASLEARLAELKSAQEADDQRLQHLELQQQEQAERVSGARVELARCEQQVETLRNRTRQFQEDHQERSRLVRESQRELEGCLERQRLALRAILGATSELAELYLRKERLADDVVGHFERRRQLVRDRDALAEQLQALRAEIRRLEQQQHKVELDAGQWEHERSALASRLREDYGIEIGQLESDDLQDPQHGREEVEQEIANLRRRIQNIGAVNMEALDELDELEGRFGSLSSQYQDLDQAKQALERIINKINADSRRLFTETLEAIRANFQSLYRKAFGGGRADIVLEEGEDILECGIEIIATPPGKPSFNNSLLSGGEKALTAVALLLAIFQFRPSPFCVLDEVDAPFDEANIGRFVDVLKDFLGWTKFVIVTHSKKTMTSANTLYGVTMQESGVSKQVSVRFEDVSDDGQISPEALRREADGEPDADSQPEPDSERGAA
ncbi:MAG: chromosome segregation protein SMC [Pirellulaceae bacterium]|nr:chromosome segregation protein SMC [Pirellulaceae bacterium]